MKKHRNIPKEAEILRDKRLEMSLTQMDVALEAGIQLRQYQRLEFSSAKAYFRISSVVR